MIRFGLLLALTMNLAGGAIDAWAQSEHPTKVWTVGILMVAAQRDDPIVAGLRQAFTAKTREEADRVLEETIAKIAAKQAIEKVQKGVESN